jgi:endonuclease YncB( thermonuclease family)
MSLRIRSVITVLSALAACLTSSSTVFAKQSHGASAPFLICSDGARINCVVDGDTFWFQGEKIRISDVDTPELSPPRCRRERELGLAAKQRLLDLLNEGSFSLTSGAREEDRYGRKLRNVNREGKSIGDTLVAEGLARRWDGSRRSWCE